MKKVLLFLFLFAITSFVSKTTLHAQTLSTDPKQDVMMQGFFWDSYNNAKIISGGGLYNYLKKRVSHYQSSGINLIWLPPASNGAGMGYYPAELNNFSSAHGNETDLKALLAAFKTAGIHSMADIIANHRSGTKAWADFTNPVWGCEVITADDEVNAQAGQIHSCSSDYDEGETESGCRDMNHKSVTTQNGYKDYLTKLKTLGFDSWRWDKTKGYPGKYNGEYNAKSSPYFSVGEYFDANISLLTGWINSTGNSFTGTTKKSATFDFSLYYILDRAVKGSYGELNNGGGMPGLAGTYGYSDYAVTFVENHDVHNISGNDNLMKGNAYILTHPGIPMIFLPNYEANQQKINELIAIRKQNGINAWSSVSVTNSSTFYSATIDGKVVVKIGPGMWSPGTGWILNTSGTDYAVWSKMNVTFPTITPLSATKITLTGIAVGGWSTDVELSTTDGINYSLTKTFVAGGAKFRADLAWTANWGAATFPTGTGVQGGVDIPVLAGTYKVDFNINTGKYTFTAVTTDIKDVAESVNILNVFPNPTSDNVTVKSTISINQIQLFDMYGKLVQTIEESGNEVMLNLSDLSSGIYFAVIKTNKSIDTVKIKKN